MAVRGTDRPRASLEAGAVGFEFLLGVGKEHMKCVEKVARPSDSIGVANRVQPQGAIHLRPRAEAQERPVGLEIGAEEVSPWVELVPEAHRLADLVGGLGWDGCVLGRWGGRCSGLWP